MGWSGKTGTVVAGQCARNGDGSYSAVDATAAILEVTSWDANANAKVASYGHSESAGFDVTCTGTKSVSGTIEVKLQSSLALVPGVVYSFVLRNAAITLAGMGCISGIPVSTKIDGGDPVSATYNWTSNGAWTFSTGTGVDG